MTIVHPWTVTVVAEGDRELAADEFARFADVIQAAGGTALGEGTETYGVTIVLAAAARDEAIRLGTRVLAAAAERAGLPSWPVATAAAGQGPPGSALPAPDPDEHSGYADPGDPPDE